MATLSAPSSRASAPSSIRCGTSITTRPFLLNTASASPTSWRPTSTTTSFRVPESWPPRPVGGGQRLRRVAVPLVAASGWGGAGPGGVPATGGPHAGSHPGARLVHGHRTGQPHGSIHRRGSDDWRRGPGGPAGQPRGPFSGPLTLSDDSPKPTEITGYGQYLSHPRRRFFLLGRPWRRCRRSRQHWRGEEIKPLCRPGAGRGFHPVCPRRSGFFPQVLSTHGRH